MEKITVIGAGSVGATVANDLMVQGLASEIVLVDVNKKKAVGEALVGIHAEIGALEKADADTGDHHAHRRHGDPAAQQGVFGTHSHPPSGSASTPDRGYRGACPAGPPGERT